MYRLKIHLPLDTINKKKETNDENKKKWFDCTHVGEPNKRTQTTKWTLRKG